MLKAVAEVCKELRKQCKPHELDLQRITNMFKAITTVDDVIFVQYDAPEENPIWGEFSRWSMRPGVYVSFKTIVEIRYALHLLKKEEWLRLVICKELCHSLESPSGKHDVSEQAVDDLVAKFSLVSTQQPVSDMTNAYRIEMLAEVGAIELLCPLETRKEIIAKDGQPNAAQLKQIAQKYNFPLIYAAGAFKSGYMEAVEELITGA